MNEQQLEQLKKIQTEHFPNGILTLAIMPNGTLHSVHFRDDQQPERHNNILEILRRITDRFLSDKNFQEFVTVAYTNLPPE